MLIKLKVTLIMLKVTLIMWKVTLLKKHKGDGVILKNEKREMGETVRIVSACWEVLSTGFGVLLVF